MKTAYHSFQIFKNHNIIQAFSKRSGGFSKGIYHSLNLGLTTADNIEHVNKNRQKFFDDHKIKIDKLVIPSQVHSDKILVVTKAGIYKDTDSLITNIKGIILSIQTADCYPIFIHDPKKNICAIVHSGWRGAVLNITGKTLHILIDKFGCKSNNILVGIGAGIRQNSYQIDHKTAANFDKKYIVSDGSEHYKLDIQKNIVDQILECGIPLNNIEKDDRCTFENSDLFYSYRRDGIYSGRMMGIIGLI